MLVADRDGRQLFSSVTSDTASLPPRNNRDIVDKVFTTRRPFYSNLFTGSVKKLRDVVSKRMPPTQTPNYYVVGATNQAFLRSRAFSI